MTEEDEMAALHRFISPEQQNKRLAAASRFPRVGTVLTRFFSVMEESESGVDQNDAELVAGFDHHLVRSRTSRSRDEPDAALKTHRERRSEVKGQRDTDAPGSGSLPVWPGRCCL